MEKTVIQSTPLGKQSMLDKLYKNDSLCIAIAKKVNSDVGSDFIGYIRRGNFRFIDCQRIEVSRGTPTHFQKFDFVFSVTCHYEKTELIEGHTDTFNYFRFQDIKVVVRDRIDIPAEFIVNAMQNVFKGKVLLLQSYAGNIVELKKQLVGKQIHLLLEEELI